MTGSSPFDHRPDPELGAALREALTTGDDRDFARRVVAAAEHVFVARAGAHWWEELVRWSRPSLAAAALALAAGAALWFAAARMTNAASDPLGDPLRAADSRLGVPALLASSQAPHVDEVLAVALGN